LRLVHQITPILFETLLFGLIGDQFEESDNVVGCVLSKRNGEDILSVWVEEEGESVKSGQLRYVTSMSNREKRCSDTDAI
jgi:translation initiation factor 4E